jgi:hypothetical protein
MQALRELEPFFKIYVGIYVTLIVLGLVALYVQRKRLSLFTGDYRKFLGQPWRLTTFTIAAVGMVIVAPYTGDPTWDYFDAAMMSILCYLTAPWAVGTLYMAMAGRARTIEVFIACVLWLSTASWCYDLYILFKQGMYPVTWAWNIAASSVLYACAGLMWNLDWRAGHGVVFAFREPGWPQAVSGASFMRIAGFALPFMLIVGLGVAYFLRTQL